MLPRRMKRMNDNIAKLLDEWKEEGETEDGGPGSGIKGHKTAEEQDRYKSKSDNIRIQQMATIARQAEVKKGIEQFKARRSVMKEKILNAIAFTKKRISEDPSLKEELNPVLKKYESNLKEYS